MRQNKKTQKKKWDLIVIGGGHAGCEAAHAAASMGCSTLLLTMKKETIGKMSCNPAIGGVGKGHLVKEIDALGGIMGFVADETAIQFRKLNTKKGVAVQATRCQSDMHQYNQKMIETIQSCPNLFVREGEVVSFLLEKGEICGVQTSLRESILSKAVVLTGGTFLRGKIHIGDKQFEAGRVGESPANQISVQLEKLRLKMGRLKTGTTPRLDKNTIQFGKLELQHGDKEKLKFSFWNSKISLPQVPCYITYTNEKTHRIIAENISLSAAYNGDIQSSGPRYCPSIEDKIVRFADKKKHQIFLEPTSLDSIEIYPNGISTSLPEKVQLDFVRSIKGLEEAKIIRAGYAVEYDFVFPNQLQLSLELKSLKGLFLAGQINGTTGYEEAAAQGLIAGINAALQIQKKEPLILTRDVAYLAVLIDDLVTKGTEEPYRMFTSRAEYRLLLREENADQRLCEIGYKIGLLSKAKYQKFCQKYKKVESLKKWTASLRLKPSEKLLDFYEKKEISQKNYKLTHLLKQPTVAFKTLEKFFPAIWKKELKQWEQVHKNIVETDLKYEGYIKKQQVQLKQYHKLHLQPIPHNLDYSLVGGLSAEVKEKLVYYRPENLSQMLKISGITPAATTILMVYLKKLAA